MFSYQSRLYKTAMGLSKTLNRLLLSFLWWSLHFVLSCYVFFATMLSCSLTVTNPFHYWNSHRFLAIAAKDLQRLSKVPAHLAIVFSGNPREFATRNLVELISWSTAFRIPTITVYDTQGFWRSKRCEIRLLMEEELSKKFRVVMDNPHVCEKTCDVDLQFMTSSPSDLSSLSGPHITFLTEADGKASIASAAREICSDVKSRRIAVPQIDQHLLDSYIRRKTPVTDPDLILKIGRVDSLSGYLPWHVRLSEIRYMPRHSRVTFQEFRDALYRFSRVEQRFGR